MKPSAPVVTVGQASTTGVTLSWTGSAKTYNILGATGTRFTNGITFATNITKLTGFVKLPQAGPYSLVVVASNGGTYTTASASKVATVLNAKPAAPTLTVSPALTGATLSWSYVTSNAPVTYQPIVDAITYGSRVSGLSTLVPVSGGATHTFRVLAYSGTTFSTSTTVTRFLPFQKPTAPVLNPPIVGETGITLSWAPSISNTGITYAAGLYVGGVLFDGSTGLTGTTVNVAYPSFGLYTPTVIAYAGNTFSSSSAAPIVIAPPAPTSLQSEFVTTQGCQLSWAPPAPVIGTLSYAITSASTFTTVLGPTFDAGSNLWLAGVSFGQAKTYDFLVKRIQNGATGPASSILVTKPRTTRLISKFYTTPGTYTITIPYGFSGFQAQLVGGGGGGASNLAQGVYGGGGGAGGFAAASYSSLSGSTFTLVVGSGGGGGGNSSGSVPGDPQGTGFWGDNSILNQTIAYAGRGGRGVGSLRGGDGGGFSGAEFGLTGGNGQSGAVLSFETPTPQAIGASGPNALGGTYGAGGNSAVSNGKDGQAGCALITFFP